MKALFSVGPCCNTTLALAALGARIGIVVSPAPALAPIAEQFDIRATHACNEIARVTPGLDCEPVRLDRDFGPEEAIRTLTDPIAAKGIRAIIAESIDDRADTRRRQMTRWATPTVIGGGTTPHDPTPTDR